MLTHNKKMTFCYNPAIVWKIVTLFIARASENTWGPDTMVSGPHVILSPSYYSASSDARANT